jgi:DivIVA domain-containing protein
MTSHQQDNSPEPPKPPEPPNRPEPPNLSEPPEPTLSPDEIADHVFPNAFRGYDMDAVRQFLTRVADRMRELEKAGDGPTPSSASLGFDDVGAEVAGILRAAHESAEAQIARAQEQAATITSKAEESTAEITARAVRLAADAEKSTAEMTERAARLAAETDEQSRTATERVARLAAEADEQSRIATERRRRSAEVLQRTIADLKQLLDASERESTEEIIDLTKTEEAARPPDQGPQAGVDSAGGPSFIHSVPNESGEVPTTGKG